MTDRAPDTSSDRPPAGLKRALAAALGALLCVLPVALLAAAPAPGAFPGTPGPIAYQKVFGGEEGQEASGGLVAHPPRRPGR